MEATDPNDIAQVGEPDPRETAQATQAPAKIGGPGGAFRDSKPILLPSRLIAHVIQTRPEAAASLTGTGLTLWRGSTCLFEDLAFEVPGGSALLIRGPNGSGKTTLLRVISGLTTPESGEIHWHGKSLRSAARQTTVLAYSGHATALKADLTIRENLSFFARLQGVSADRLMEYLEAVGVADRADLPVRLLSAGQKRRTALARLLMSPAPLWLLDEPHTNLDAAGRRFLDGALTRHLAAGGIAAIAAHQPFEADARVVELHLGSARADGVAQGDAPGGAG